MDASKKLVFMSNSKRRAPFPSSSGIEYTGTDPIPGRIFNSKPAARPVTVPRIIGFTPRLSHRRPANIRGSQCYTDSPQVLDFQRLLTELKCKIIRTRKSLHARPVTTISTVSYEAMFNRFRSNQRARNRNREIIPMFTALAYSYALTLFIPHSIFNTLPH